MSYLKRFLGKAKLDENFSGKDYGTKGSAYDYADQEVRLQKLQKKIKNINLITEKFISNPKITPEELQTLLKTLEAEDALAILLTTYNDEMTKLDKERVYVLNELENKDNEETSLSGLSYQEVCNLNKSKIEVAFIRHRLNLINELLRDYNVIYLRYHVQELDSRNFREFSEQLKAKQEKFESALSEYDNASDVAKSNFFVQNGNLKELNSNLIELDGDKFKAI